MLFFFFSPVFFSSNAINHLASADHLKNLKHFLWKFGGGTDYIDKFRITDSEVDKVICASSIFLHCIFNVYVYM